MLRLSDLVIDNKSLGSKLWLTDILPVFEYRDNRRTDVITGYRYILCLPDMNFEKVGIKIEGKKLLEKPSGYAEVKFDDLELFIYYLNGIPQFGGKASSVALVSNSKVQG